MILPATLTLYNASAGSGKTFILVKHYLAFLLKDPFSYKSILVVTFTNKAALEIEKRILSSLIELSRGLYLENKNPLFSILSLELGLSLKEMQAKAKEALRIILHDFSSFSISTIDTFTYKILKSFYKIEEEHKEFTLAFNLKKILQQAIDIFLSQLDYKYEQTDLLVDFSLANIEKNKSWDPSFKLYQIASLLTKEQNFTYLDYLTKYKQGNFNLLTKKLEDTIYSFEQELVIQANSFFAYLKDHLIEEGSFFYGDLPKYFKKLKEKKISSSLFTKRLEENIHLKKLYSKTLHKEQKAIIDEKTDAIITFYDNSKKYYEKFSASYFLSKIVFENIFYMRFITEVEKQVTFLKKENKILFISDLNKKINHQIKDASIPIIYEGLGERYNYYFIDEFQDTSSLQWDNLKILIENALSQNGSVLILGDAKQSIYRWRAGDVEQFIDLFYTKELPYYKKEESLNVNYRSYGEIVKFNNSFYDSSLRFLKNPYYEKIYRDTLKQNHIKDNKGYIEIHFLEEEKEYKKQTYEKVKEKIKTLRKQGYHYNQMALLVRNNKESAFLIEQCNLDDIPIYSSESLLLKNTWQVNFMICLFMFLSHPKQKSLQIDIILILIKNKIIEIKDHLHDFLLEISCLSYKEFFEKLTLYKIHIDIEHIYNIGSLYALAEYIVEGFHIKKFKDHAPILTFFDFILDNEHQFGNSLERFLDYWNEEKDQINLKIDQKINAIELLSIHKSKGLEYPIILFPFASWNGFSEHQANSWLRLDADLFESFDFFHVRLDERLKHAGTMACELYEDHLAKLRFDNLNLLYVATTRAIDQLIIFTQKSSFSNKNISIYFETFLKEKSLWKEDQFIYSFGISEKISSFKKQEQEDYIHNPFYLLDELDK